MVDDKEDQISESIKKENPDLKSTLLGDHGKLWIRLKLNPSSDDDGDEEQEQDEEEDFAKDQKQPPQSNNKNNNTRICQVCNKVFGSGKAFGGHTRIHVPTNKDLSFSKKLIISSQQPSFMKLKKKRKREAAAAADFDKRKDLLRIKSSSNDHDSAAAGFNNNKINPTCYICGKNFPSMKSLFGHMRCHPDREWRGIQPPPSAAIKASPLSSVSDAEPQKTGDYYHQLDSAVADGDQTVDLTKSLGNWLATAKRGRKAIVENSEEDEDKRMRDAVYHLMSLAQGEDSSCEAKLVTNGHEVEEFEATNSNSLTYKTENEDTMTKMATPGSKKARKKKFSADHPEKELRNEERKLDGIHLDDRIHMGNNTKAVQETDFFAGKLANLDYQWEENTWPKDYYGEKDCSESENTHDDPLLINHENFESTDRNAITVKSRKKRKKMRLRDLESVHDDASPVLDQVTPVLTMTTSPEKYRCSTCYKCFTTHQALGGHRSSHNKFRMVIHNSFGESTSAAGEDENLGNYSPSPGVEESKESDEGAASSYQCKICNRNFPTGQALGGHKRCHWTAGQVEGPSCQVTSAGRRVMEFDLNEMPPLEEDAGIESDHAAGYGCSTSAFNSVEFSGFYA